MRELLLSNINTQNWAREEGDSVLHCQANTDEFSDIGLYDGNTVGELVIAACRRHADREAVVFQGCRWTYDDLAIHISRAVQFFEAVGLRHGQGIAILGNNRPEIVSMYLAAQLCGLRYTPLRALGSQDDHAFVLEDAEISLLVVDADDFGEMALTLKERVPNLTHVFAMGSCEAAPDILEAMAKFAPQRLVNRACPDDIALIGYTGGTTGRPKGVVHTHRSWVAFNLIAICEWEWPSQVRFLAATPISHAAISWILPTFIKGGTFVLAKSFTPKSFLAAIEAERITMSFLVPTMLYGVLDYPDRNRFDLGSLEGVIYGAAPMSPTRLVEALEIFGPIFSQFYGQTEGPTVLTYLPRDQHDPSRPEKLLSCGYPAAALKIRLLDSEGREVPAGEVGEICVRGPLVMQGYWRRPEETAAALANGWLHTGDLAKADEEGYLYIVDRAKDMIISGGFNVYPKEVEDALTTYPTVASAAVIGLPHPVWGEAVTAIVVLREGAHTTGSELAAHVKTKKGAEYAPKHVEFVNAIPVTPFGKFDKSALRQRFAGIFTVSAPTVSA